MAEVVARPAAAAVYSAAARSAAGVSVAAKRLTLATNAAEEGT